MTLAGYLGDETCGGLVVPGCVQSIQRVIEVVGVDLQVAIDVRRGVSIRKIAARDGIGYQQNI
jgi:hypothetical protein